MLLMNSSIFKLLRKLIKKAALSDTHAATKNSQVHRVRAVNN